MPEEILETHLTDSLRRLGYLKKERNLKERNILRKRKQRNIKRRLKRNIKVKDVE